MEKGYLVLQDGRVFEGVRFGAAEDAVGELVFHTGAGGFLGNMTDPACAGQIVMQTYPFAGNYGIVREDLEGGCGLRGYVARECCESPSNFRCEGDLDSWLKEQGVPGLAGVDTRELTRILREEGAMNALICSVVPSDLEAVKNYVVPSARETGRRPLSVYPAKGEEKYAVTMIDCGAKRSFISALQAMGCTITAVPADASAEFILAAKPDGVVLSAGPGDPAANTELIEEVKKLLGKTPLLGVGLGHQVTALAAGAKTEKMTRGHRGGNQPVRDTETGRVWITAQNHGYAVVSDSVTGGTVRYVNVNDGTCEGIDYPEKNAFTVQFDPILCSNSKTANILLERFAEMMKGGEA